MHDVVKGLVIASGILVGFYTFVNYNEREETNSELNNYPSQPMDLTSSLKYLEQYEKKCNSNRK